MKVDTLLIGSSGKLGKDLKNCLGSRCIATSRKVTTASGDIALDLQNPAVFDWELLKGFRYGLLLAAVSDPDKCFLDPTTSRAINVDGTIKVLDEMKKYGVKPIFLSSEMVFNGENGNYSEEHVPDPILLYGQHKRLVELHIQDNFDDFLILRLAKIYSIKPGDGSLFNQFQQSALKLDSAVYATDQFFTPTAQGDFNSVISRCLDFDVSGLFHLSSGYRMSRWELYELFAEKSGLQAWARPGLLKDFPFVEPRPRDLSLDGSALASSLSFTYTSPEQGLGQWISNFEAATMQ
jgi:dTDP-4-dehydrorhamnose reductase